MIEIGLGWTVGWIADDTFDMAGVWGVDFVGHCGAHQRQMVDLRIGGWNILLVNEMVCQPEQEFTITHSSPSLV